MRGDVYILAEPDGRRGYALATGNTGPADSGGIELLDATGRRVVALDAAGQPADALRGLRYCLPFAGPDELALLMRAEAIPEAVAAELAAVERWPESLGVFETPAPPVIRPAPTLPPPRPVAYTEPAARPWWRRLLRR